MRNTHNKIHSTAVVFARRSAFLGLILGLIYSIGGAISDFLMDGEFNNGTYLAFMAIVGMPFMFAVLCYLLGFVFALIGQNRSS